MKIIKKKEIDLDLYILTLVKTVHFLARASWVISYPPFLHLPPSSIERDITA